MNNDTVLKITGVLLILLIVGIVIFIFINGASCLTGEDGLVGCLIDNWQDLMFAPLEKWMEMKWAILDNVIERVGKIPFDEVPVEDIGEGAKDAGEDIGEGVKDAAEDVGDGVSDAVDAISGLF